MKSNLADVNVNLDVRGLQWQTQWDQGKSANPADRQDIFIFYWWPDYPDPVSWFYNLFRTEKAPFFNLAYYSNPSPGLRHRPGLRSSRPPDRDTGDAQMYRDMQQMPVRRRAGDPAVHAGVPARDAELGRRLRGQPGLPERGLRLRADARRVTRFVVRRLALRRAGRPGRRRAHVRHRPASCRAIRRRRGRDPAARPEQIERGARGARARPPDPRPDRRVRRRRRHRRLGRLALNPEARDRRHRAARLGARSSSSRSRCCCALAVGIPLGLVAARWKGKVPDVRVAPGRRDRGLDAVVLAGDRPPARVLPVAAPAARSPARTPRTWTTRARSAASRTCRSSTRC